MRSNSVAIRCGGTGFYVLKFRVLWCRVREWSCGSLTEMKYPVLADSDPIRQRVVPFTGRRSAVDQYRHLMSTSGNVLKTTMVAIFHGNTFYAMVFRCLLVQIERIVSCQCN